MGTLRLAHLILEDRWPGAVNPNLGIPTGGFDATAWNFSTADDTAKAFSPPYPAGTKIMAYTDNSECPGFYTMMYLARHEFSAEAISSDFSEANFYCSKVGTSEVTHTAIIGSDATSVPPYYVVSQCYTAITTDISEGTPVAMACTTADADSSITLTTDPRATGYGHAWGFFWVGGVCPAKDITLFKGLGDSLAGVDITVQADMRPGAVYMAISGSSYMLATADPSHFNASDATSVVSPVPTNVGWACSSEE